MHIFRIVHLIFYLIGQFGYFSRKFGLESGFTRLLVDLDHSHVYYFSKIIFFIIQHKQFFSEVYKFKTAFIWLKVENLGNFTITPYLNQLKFCRGISHTN